MRKDKEQFFTKMSTWRFLPVPKIQQAFLVLKANLKLQKPGATVPFPCSGSLCCFRQCRFLTCASLYLHHYLRAANRTTLRDAETWSTNPPGHAARRPQVTRGIRPRTCPAGPAAAPQPATQKHELPSTGTASVIIHIYIINSYYYIHLKTKNLLRGQHSSFKPEH